MSSSHPHFASIVINNYNYRRFLPQAIESALAQSHAPTEVIVVDDGSTDGSERVISAYGARIRAILKENGGQGSALSAGFGKANGDIVIFLDADDLLHPDAVARVLENWRDGTVMAQYRMDVIDAEGCVIGEYPPPWQPLADGDVREELLATGSFPTTVTSGLAFMRRSLSRLMPIPSQDFRLAADGYLVRAAGLLGPVQAIDLRLGCYRRHGKNDSALTANADNPAEFFRKKIKYIRNEHRTLRALAAVLNLTTSEQLGEEDVEYLACRLFSLALDAPNHPIPGDELRSLVPRYLLQRWRQRGPRLQTLADIVAALGVTLLPPPARIPLVHWRKVPERRPRWLRRVVQSLTAAQELPRLAVSGVAPH